MFKKKLDFSKKKEANTEMNHVFGSIHLKLFANLKTEMKCTHSLKKIIYYKSKVQIVFYLLKIIIYNLKLLRKKAPDTNSPVHSKLMNSFKHSWMIITIHINF